MATSQPKISKTSQIFACNSDSDQRSAIPPDLHHWIQHADRKSSPVQDRRLSATAGNHNFLDINSMKKFPDLCEKDQNLIDLSSFKQPKAWVDVIKENNYHQNTIQLSFFEPAVKDDMKLAVINEDLTNKARKRWINSIVFYVFGYKPYYNFLKSYIDRNWKIKGNYQLYSRDNGFYILKCENDEECERILAEGPYYYNKRLIFIKKWEPGVKLTKEFLSSLPIWIRLPNFDLDFWTVESISRIASLLGNPLKLDNVTESLVRISYARVLVEVNSEFKFPEVVPIQCYNGDIVWQRVVYEWVPPSCTGCKIFGHSFDNCKSFKFWSPKNNSNPENGMDIDDKIVDNMKMDMNNDYIKGCQDMATVVDARKGRDEVSIVKTVNPFQVLEDDNMNLQNNGERYNEAEDSVNACKNDSKINNMQNIRGEVNMQDACELSKGDCKGIGKPAVHVEIGSMKVREELSDKQDCCREIQNCEDVANKTNGEDAINGDFLMNDSDSSFGSYSYTNSFKKRRITFKTSNVKKGNKVDIDEPLVEDNPEWIKLMNDIQSRSKARKGKKGGGNPSGVTNGGVSKK